MRIKNKINNFPIYTFLRCNRPDIRVACILDTFSYECFKYECSLEQLRSGEWKKQIYRIKPHFLFVESAWRGIDDTWRNKLVNIQKKPQSEIRELIEYCNKKKIKTVFWNKEDPPNYGYFIETAKLFDTIFTTDKNSIKRYKKDVGHNQIYELPFAAQPAIHNPVHTSFVSKENVAFAGTWYAKKYPQRQQDMNILLNPAKKWGLHVFDRMYEFNGNNNYRYPDNFLPYIAGSLDYETMLKAYRLYKVFLNVNSVSSSPTMFSRRVFETLACGTNVISTYSKGIKDMFKGIVLLSKSDEDTSKYLARIVSDPQYNQRLSVLGVRKANSKHRYEHRFNYILNKVGIEEKKGRKKVLIIVCVNRPEYIKNIFNNYNNQAWQEKELIIILKNEGLSLKKWEKKARKHKNVRVYQLPEEKNGGECINYAVNKTKATFIAKFNEEDYYAPHYLTDLIYAFNYTDADIVGKKAHYTYSEQNTTLFLRYPEEQNVFVNTLLGGTLLIKRKVFKHVKYPKKAVNKDSRFLMRCASRGIKMYASNPYNYVHHTMKFQEERFKKPLIISNTGDYRAIVTI